MCTVNVLKFRTLFSFCYEKKLFIKKMLERIANNEDPDQTAFSEQSDLCKKQSDLGLHWLFRPFGRELVLEILEHLP